MEYRKRIVDNCLTEYLRIFGALLIEGPKWCGKTWTARYAAKSEFDVASPENGFRNRELARLDPEAVLAGAHPRLLDEWQEVPTLWDAVRYEVDRRGEKGLYLLTGSSTPDDSQILHSGAGRFGRIRMRTMTLQELGVSTGNISLAGLLSGNQIVRDGAMSARLTYKDIAGMVSKGGWPGLIGVALTDAQEVVDSYVRAVVETDISKIDGIKRDPAKVMALLRSLGRNTATMVKKATLEKDIAEFSGVKITADTIGEYLVLLERLFLLENIPAWEPPLKSTVRLRTAPKRVLTDVSIAASALGANQEALGNDPKILGMLFEGLVLHELLVYAAAASARVFHYADNSDLEVDAIVERKDGVWGAIEVKLGYHQEDDAAGNLLRLLRKLRESRQREPAFLAVITGVGSLARRRADGVWVIPVDHLGY